MGEKMREEPRLSDENLQARQEFPMNKLAAKAVRASFRNKVSLRGF